MDCTVSGPAGFDIPGAKPSKGIVDKISPRESSRAGGENLKPRSGSGVVLSSGAVFNEVLGGCVFC